MWKKILVSLIAIIGTCSVAFAFNQDIFADTNSLSASLGDLTGRIGPGQKGDRYYLNPRVEYADIPITVQLIHNNVDASRGYGENVWFSFTTIPITETPVDFGKNPNTVSLNNENYTGSIPEAKVQALSNQLTSYDLNVVKQHLQPITPLGDGLAAEQPTKEPYFFTVGGWEISGKGSSKNLVPLDDPDRFFTSPYWMANVWGGNNSFSGYDSNGIIDTSPDYKYVRPAIYIDTNNIVFSVSSGLVGGNIGKITAPSYTPGTNIMGAIGNPMKIRVFNSTLIATMNKLKDKSGNEISLVVQDSTVYIDAYANSGSSYGIYTVSVIVYDANGNFAYYKPLGPASGSSTYAFDLSGIPAGNYKIAIVNETYNEGSKFDPAYSSAISAAKDIQIVEALSDLKYQPITSESTYGSAQTKGGQAIGTISSQNGAGTPIYQVIEDPAYPGHSSNFEMGSVNANHQANVLIKGKTTDSLKAGTYHFLVQATDANGDPDPALTVPVSITVKPQASTLAFTQTGSQEMKIGGQAFTGTISYSNTDANFTPKLELDAAAKGLLTVSLNSDKKTYTVTPASTYTGIELPKTFTLTLSGNATTNYSAPKSVTKTFTLYKDLSGLKWTGWSEGQVDYPIDTVSDANIAIGTLVAVDGYPNFTYSIESSTDNMFKLAKTTGAANEKINVQITGKLSAKKYTINFKVVDQKNVSKTVSATINVTLKTQNKLYFANASGTDITSSGQSVAYGSTDRKLLTKGGSSSKTVTYALAPANEQPSAIGSNASDYVSINSSTGEITPKKVGTVKVMATKPADDTYSATNAKMNLTITSGGQSITWPNVNDNSYHVFDQGKSFTVPNAVLTRDDQTTGTIGYSTSTTNVCTVSGTTITMKTTGTCEITASNKDANYKEASKTVKINLYTGISGSFNSVKVNQGSEEAKGGSTTSLAAVSLSGGDGTYKQTAFKVTKDNVDMTASFTISGSDKLWRITPEKDLKYGTYHVSVTFTDGHGGAKVITGTITVGLQTNSAFKLVDGKGTDIPNNIITKEYAKDLSFNVLAKGELGTGKLHYRMSDDSTTSDPAVTIDETTGLISVSRATTDNETYKVYALVEEDSVNGYAKQTTQEVTIKITNGTQSIKFDSSIPDAVTFTENKELSVPAILTRNDGTSGTIKYTSTTTDVCTIQDETVAKVTLIKDANGTCTITASNSDEHYGKAEATKSIVIYAGIKGSFHQKQKPLNQGEETAKKGKNIANISPITGGDGTYSYDSLTAKKEGQDVSATFTMDSKTGEITLNKDLVAGDYEITVTISDGHEGLVNISYTLSVDLQTNTDFKLTYQGKAPSNDQIVVDYHSVKDSGISVSTVGKLGNDTIHYAMSEDSTKTDPAVSIEDDTIGLLKVDHVTKAGEVYKVYAYVNEDTTLGYAKQKTKEISIIVEETAQTISFTDPDDSEHALNGGSFTETATAKLKNQDIKGVGTITYSSDNEDVLTIDSDGVVTMHKAGEATITATITDENGNYASASTTKKIIVHDGIVADFKPVTPHIQASDGEPKENIVVGTLSTSGGGSKKPSYQLSTDDVPENKDNALFTIDPDTGAVKLKKTITPAQLNAHGKEYKIRSEVTVGSDTITKDIIIEIDPAAQEAYFMDETGKKLISIIEAYKKDGTFHVQIHKQGSGNVTYELKDSSSKNVIEVDDTQNDLIHILKATNPAAPEEVILVATIEEKDGYEKTVIEIPVTITLAKQSIAFEEQSDVSIEFAKDGIYESPAKLYEADQTESKRLITYSSEDESICTIDQDGNVTMLKVGTCKIKASNKDTNYEAVETKTKTITIYEGMTTVFTQAEGEKPQAGTASTAVDSPIGSVKTEGGVPDISYRVSEETSDDNAQRSYFDVTATGVVVLTKQLEASDLAGLDINEDGYYVMKVVFIGTDKLGHEKAGKADILIRGAQTSIEVKGADHDGNITKTYVPDGRFTISTSNSGKAIPEYSLPKTDGNPQDVIEVSTNGTSKILNACVGDDLVKVEVKLPAKNGYDGATKTINVKVIQAEQSDFSFAKEILELQEGSSVEPMISGVKALDDTGKPKQWTLISDDASIAEINGTSIKAVGKQGEETIIKASVEGDRNYLPATTKVKVIITQDPAYQFLISVPKATYGDNDKDLYAKVVVDTGKGNDKKQSWISENTEVAEIDPATGKLTIKKAGKTKITCTQTSTGEASVTDSATFVVLPKPIIVQIEDKTKKYGEALPEFTIKAIEGLVGNDTIGEPNYLCKDKETVVSEATKPGAYDITGSYDTAAYPNYSITVKPGKLTITQDPSKPVWYELIGKDSEQTGTKATWFKEAVKVRLGKAKDSDYDRISIDELHWYEDYALVENEGNNELDVYFKATNTSAQATTQKTNVKIDTTAPQIINMTGTRVEQNALEKVLNALSFDTLFKANDLFTIEVKDVQKDNVNEVSGVETIRYQAYRIDIKTGEIDDQPYVEDRVKVKENKAEFRITNPGKYRICATAIDVAGNASKRSCSDIHIKRINVDVDDDGEDDFTDSNNPGCPDLNIKWKTVDENGNEIDHLINIDRDHDAIPDLNIDASGDGKPDLNIDTDHDGKPDVNLLILSKSEWTPNQCANADIIDLHGEQVEYCTGTSAKPVINVDTNNDGIPDSNIDTNGDMKPDINITKEGSTTPYLNIILDTHLVWKPTIDKTHGSFQYDTMELKPEYNIDTNGDSLPDLNIDIDGDGKPDLNIDINGDMIPDTNIDGNGDGIADYNLDDGTGTPSKNVIELTVWKPNIKGSVNGIAFGTMELQTIPELEDQGIIIKYSKGDHFTPNYRLRVQDVTEKQRDALIHDILDDTKSKTIKQVYEVSLLKDGIEVNADGQLSIKIPAIKGLKNPSLLIQLKDGSYKAIVAEEHDGYYVYESDYLGIVAILADVDETSSTVDTATKPNTDPNKTKPSKIPDEHSGGAIQEHPSNVKGSYQSSVNSGDSTNSSIRIQCTLGSMIVVFLLLKRQRKHRNMIT